MLHLTAERLAALADEEPTMLEAAHLAACPECCRERSAHQRLVALAAEERTRIAPPLTSWEALGPALARMRAEERGGDEVATTTGDPQVTPIAAAAAGRRSGAWSRARHWGLRAASAIALLGAGALAGRMSAAPEQVAVLAPGTDGGQEVMPGGRVRDILISLPRSAPIEFASNDEALRALELAEHLYQQSQSYLVEHDTSAAPIDAAELYRARLAALDRVMQVTQDVLRETPLTAVDPMLNRYYMTTANAREATLRELRAKLPPGYDMKRF